MTDNEHLVLVRFRPKEGFYSFKAPKSVSIGDSVFVKTWVRPEGVVLKVEEVSPLDNKFNYSYARKVDNDQD